METKIEQKHNYESVKGDELILKYKYRAPLKPTDHPGLILLLHGVGSNEEDLFRFAGQLPADKVVISARAPYTLSPGKYAWYEVDFSSGKPVFNQEQAGKSLQVLKLFINQLTEKYQIDRTQVYLTGFSQGAILSYSAGLTFPEKITGIAALSGRVLEEIRPMIKNTPQLAKLKVFIAHGTEDRVLPVQYAREAKELIGQYGLALSYHVYPMGHGIDHQVLNDLNGWLEQS